MDAYCYCLLHVHLAQLAWIENCSTGFVLAKKALQNQYINALSCFQGYEIIDVLTFNAKNCQSKIDSIEWYKLAIDAITKLKKVDVDLLKTQKSAFMIEIAQIYSDLKEYNNAENMIILVFELDSSNLIAFRILLEISCSRWNESAQDGDNIRDIFKRMIQSQNDFRALASLKVFMAMIFTVQKISESLAMECVDLFKPNVWKNKNISYDSFLVVKIYLMCLQKEGFSRESFEKEIHELTKHVSIDENVKKTCQLVLFQAGDCASKEQKWSDASFWYNQSIVIFGDLDQENSNYGMR